MAEAGWGSPGAHGARPVSWGGLPTLQEAIGAADTARLADAVLGLAREGASGPAPLHSELAARGRLAGAIAGMALVDAEPSGELCVVPALRTALDGGVGYAAELISRRGAIEAARTGREPDSYGYEFMRWGEILGSRFFLPGPIGDGELIAVLADAVWNITFLGLDDETVSARVGELEREVDGRLDGDPLPADDEAWLEELLAEAAEDDLPCPHLPPGAPMLEACARRELARAAAALGAAVFSQVVLSRRDCGGNPGPNPSYATSPKSLRYCMGLL
ncbi:hypothetical protein H6A18_10370 [Collinsella tanakaei]|uniref:hypothetical protein n=1 Tax=Collinsella tanakaei TaxID=626935 RepID=UPI00195BD298|nr:hypothetical protein [Collinsella tanakaei]MBM6756904.1 hypothetical protein [Collinsella tanakaei]